MLGGIAGARGGKSRRPTRRAGARVEPTQARQRVDDDDVRPGLEDLELRALGCDAHEALHQPAEPTFLRTALLEQRFADPALIAGLEVIQRDHRWTGSAPAVHDERPRLGQHAAGDDARKTQTPRVEQLGPRDGIEDDGESRPCRFHQQ